MQMIWTSVNTKSNLYICILTSNEPAQAQKIKVINLMSYFFPNIVILW